MDLNFLKFEEHIMSWKIRSICSREIEFLKVQRNIFYHEFLYLEIYNMFIGVNKILRKSKKSALLWIPYFVDIIRYFYLNRTEVSKKWFFFLSF